MGAKHINNTPIIENRKAKHEYFIEETLECGIVLLGNEVKSIRSGMMSIKESWIDIKNGELWLKQAHITPWETSNNFDLKRNRDIKLLAHSKEISRLGKAVKVDGYTLVPIKVYFTRGKCKILVGVCKGKKNYDKRESAKQADAKRSIDRAMKSH